jgi:PAS domain S-box-containing protein
MAPQTPPNQSKGIWIIDAEARTVYANNAMCEILGTSATKLASTDSLRFVFPEDLPAAQRLFSSKQAGSSAPFRFKLRREDGSSIWVDVQGTPLYTSDGQFDGIVGTFTVCEPQGS